MDLFSHIPLWTRPFYIQITLRFSQHGGGGGGMGAQPRLLSASLKISEQCALLAMKRAMFYCILKSDTNGFFSFFFFFLEILGWEAPTARNTLRLSLLSVSG